MKLFDSAIGKTITTRPKRFRALSSRCGVFPYLINGQLVWQYRPEEEVFNQDSIDSFLDASITIGHPEDDNQLSESHGTVYNVDTISDSAEESGIYCEFIVFTDEARFLASSGSPTSPMYDVLLVEQQGDYQGKSYDYIQKNIRYSSLGLVSNARQEKTKVFYQLSKDSNSNLLLPENLIEVPIIQNEIMKNKLNKNSDDTSANSSASSNSVLPLVPPIESIANNQESNQESNQVVINTPAIDEIENEVVDSSSFPSETRVENLESTHETNTVLSESEVNEAIDVSNETSTETSVEEPTEATSNKVVAEINCDGGVNIQRDYLDEAIDVAKRASDMGLLGFNEAMQYSLSSMNTLMRMILLKEGIEVDEWDDARGAYKVYMKLRPLSSTSSTNSDSAGSLTNNSTTKKSKPFVPKINHPLHVKQPPENVENENNKLKFFDDLE